MAKVSFKGLKKVYIITGGKKTKKNIGQEENAPHLERTDKGVVAVQDFSLEIKDKEFVVLVGPSGCGKSTTLRMVAGLEEITEGELFIGEKFVNDMAPKDRDIAMVFQNYALYPHMTVYGNMAFALKLRHEKKDVIDKKVREAADILDITELLDRKPKALSGGQRQRVAIGRAIVRNPQVFLMDEPLSNLDAKLRNQMRAEILQLRQRINTTFIYVTHDQTEAMTLGDRIVIMKDGFIMQIGTPEEVFDHPDNLFVAGFIGTPQMNFFDAKLESSSDSYYVVLHNARVRLPKVKQDILAKNDAKAQDITLGIRPDHVVICDESDPTCVPAIVDVSEMMGSSINLHVKVDEHDMIIIVPTMNLSGSHADKLAYGSKIHFKFDGDMVHMFNKEDGKSLLV
jgi:multiple sugar transport system ATP-binding protein